MPPANLPTMLPPPGARIAIVGAAGGIGRALTAALLEAGARVEALDLPASLAGWEAPAGVACHPLDATDPEAVAAAFAAIATTDTHLDGLVLLAGFALAPTPLADTPPDSFDELLRGNLASTWLCARAALPLLRRGTNPAIVTMSSGLALKSTPGYGLYAAAKAGVLAVTRTLAAEAAPTVRVNAVAPGAVDTAFLSGGTGRPAHGHAFDRERYAATIPLGRLATTEDVTGPILFLLGPAAGYLTGQTLHISGGLFMP